LLEDFGVELKKITNADGTFINYDYTNNDELKVADYSPTNRIDEVYTYDANGNRTNAGYVTGGNNQLSADAKYDYTYDDEGNLKTRRDRSTNITRTFNWDYRNRLVSVVEGGVTIAAYTYDANNERISKTIGGVTTRYVYDKSNVALEFTGAATTPSVRYFYGTRVDQILAQDKGNGNVSWDLTDQLGSVRALVGNDGTLRNRFEYDAFGNVVSTMAGATDDSRYRYTGREFDAETGLNYYRARYFDSFSGRFIGQDPIGFDAGDGNLYRYVGNSSINATDPSGLESRYLTSLLRTAAGLGNGLSHNPNTRVLDQYPVLVNYQEALNTAEVWFRTITLPISASWTTIPRQGVTTLPRWQMTLPLISHDPNYNRNYRGKATLRPGGDSGGFPTIDLSQDEFRRTHNTPNFEHVDEIKFKYRGPENINPTPPCPNSVMSREYEAIIRRLQRVIDDREIPAPAPIPAIKQPPKFDPWLL
jgi:RHS repeat-associated protein